MNYPAAPEGSYLRRGRTPRAEASEVAGRHRIGHSPDVRPYLTDALSTHGPERTAGEEEKDMFTTDSFLGAEIAYRQDRIRKDFGRRRWTRVRTDATQK